MGKEATASPDFSVRTTKEPYLTCTPAQKLCK